MRTKRPQPFEHTLASKISWVPDGTFFIIPKDIPLLAEFFLSKFQRRIKSTLNHGDDE
ncbi:MAG TPA: hypothetical protein VGF14_03560 [Alphaproteobacteria bacterium]